MNLSIIKPAQAATSTPPSSTFSTLNPAKNFSVNSNTTIGDLFSIKGGGFSLMDLIFFAVAFAFFISLSIAGLNYVLAYGDPKKVSTSSQRITNSLLGLLIVFTSFILVRIVAAIFGFGDIARTTIQ